MSEYFTCAPLLSGVQAQAIFPLSFLRFLMIIHFLTFFLYEYYRILRLAVFWVVTPCSLEEAASISETSADFYQTTQRYNSEDGHIYTRLRREPQVLLTACNFFRTLDSIALQKVEDGCRVGFCALADDRFDDGGSKHLRNVCKVLHGSTVQNIAIFTLVAVRT
jgi:hypothetical protein